MGASRITWQTPKRLKDLAYEEIKARLLRGELPADTVLSERRIAAELEMSKTPVRSAIERLEYEGYVTLSPNQGVLVRQLSLKDISHHFDLRTAIEPHTLRKLAGAITDEQAGPLKDVLRRQGEILERDDGIGSARLDIEFHLQLTRLAGNPETVRVMQHQMEMLFRIVIQVSTQNRREASYKDHTMILSALLANDAAKAVQLMQAHLDIGRNFWGDGV